MTPIQPVHASPLALALSVVAPCYNEAQTLHEFLRRVDAACRATGMDYEIVLVNDGSRDATWERMIHLLAEYPALVCVNLSRNHGHQLALTAGLSICRGERILILDADLQDPPELLDKMMTVMDQGADVVYAQRRQRAGETKLKLWTAAIFYRVIERLAETPIPRDTGDFRLITRRAVRILLDMPERHRFIRGMVSWIGFKQVAFPYDRDARFAGATGWPLQKMIKFALDAVTSFSTRPLTWASKLGFFTALFAIGLVIYSLAGWMTGAAAAGWTSLMATIAILGSVQFFVLGIFGEYLGRMYDQVKGRPLFIIDAVISAQDTNLATPGTPTSGTAAPIIHVTVAPGAREEVHS